MEEKVIKERSYRSPEEVWQKRKEEFRKKIASLKPVDVHKYSFYSNNNMMRDHQRAIRDTTQVLYEDIRYREDFPATFAQKLEECNFDIDKIIALFKQIIKEEIPQRIRVAESLEKGATSLKILAETSKAQAQATREDAQGVEEFIKEYKPIFEWLKSLKDK